MRLAALALLALAGCPTIDYCELTSVDPAKPPPPMGPSARICCYAEDGRLVLQGRLQALYPAPGVVYDDFAGYYELRPESPGHRCHVDDFDLGPFGRGCVSKP